MATLPRVTVLAAALLMLSGCVATEPGPVATPEATSEPVFASEEEALAAATKAYAAYQDMSDQIFADSGAEPDRIDQFAGASALSASTASFESFAQQNYRTVGAASVSELILQQFDSHSANGVEVMTVYLCLDISAVDVLNEDGVSVVSPTRPSKQAFEVAFDLDAESGRGLLVSRREPWPSNGICS
jgi:hypothetical protein